MLCTCSKKGLLFRQTSSLNLCSAEAVVLAEDMERGWVAGAGKEVSEGRDGGSLCFDQLSCLGLRSWQLGLLENVSVLNKGQMERGGKGPSSLG